MRSRVLLTVALVALVALPGCSFLSGDTSTSTTTGAEPRTTTEVQRDVVTFTGNAAALTFPNGTNVNGIENSRMLVRGHSRRLAESSYAISVAENISIRDNHIDRRRAVTSLLGPNELLVTIDHADGDSGVRYIDNRTVYARTTVNGSTEYTVHTGNATFALYHVRQTFGRALALLFNFGRFEAAGTVTRNNRTLIEYTLVEPTLNPRQNATVASSDGRVLVGQDGIVSLARIDVRGEAAGQPFVIDIEYEVTGRQNLSVTPPDWLPRARNASNATR